MDNFNLVKVKLRWDNGVEATYQEKIIYEGEEDWHPTTKTLKIPRHHDMNVATDSLKIHVARVFGILSIGLYKEEKDLSVKEDLMLKKI